MEKVKEAIELLLLAISLLEATVHPTVVAIVLHPTVVAPFSIYQLSSSSQSSSSVTNHSKNTVTSPRAISACGQALDALTHLKQMHLAEQRANFQSYNIGKCGKCGSIGEISGTPNRYQRYQNLPLGAINLCACPQLLQIRCQV